MKKILLSLIIFGFLLSFLLVFNITAQATQQGGTTQTGTTDTNIKTAPEIEVFPALKRIVNLLFTFLLTAAAIAIIVAGFMFVTAGGDPEGVKKAREFVIYAIIGVAVAVLAQGIVKFIEIQLTK